MLTTQESKKTKKYKVVKEFKSLCVCHYVFKVGELWTVRNMRSKKRAIAMMENSALHKIKLSRAISNSVEL